MSNNDYVGQSRRSGDDNFKVLVVGNKINFIGLIGALITVISTFTYGTVWVTKLNEKVLSNAQAITSNASATTDIVEALNQIQIDQSRTAVILDNLEKRIAKVEDKK